MVSLEEFKSKNKALWTKLDILCLGIKRDDKGLLDKLYSKQNPMDTKRTGNAGFQITLTDWNLPLNVATYRGFTEKSPYIMVESGKKLFVKDTRTNEKYPVMLTPVHVDDYNKKVGANNIVGEYALVEGDACCIASITNGCVFFDMKKPCKFCAIGRENMSNSQSVHTKLSAERKQNLIEALKIIVANPKTKQVNLTGGNTLLEDRGASQYHDFIMAIREVNKKIPIAIELCPPEQKVAKQVMEKLKELGATTIICNIEFWSDKVREELMPIKGKIPKEDYFTAYKEAIKLFGKNNVVCGIIVGVEPLEETYKAVDVMAKLGVIPEIYPFKPNKGSQMEDYPTTPTELVAKASLYASEVMKKYNLNPNETKASCMTCGACGITRQLN